MCAHIRTYLIYTHTHISICIILYITYIMKKSRTRRRRKRERAYIYMCIYTRTHTHTTTLPPTTYLSHTYPSLSTKHKNRTHTYVCAVHVCKVTEGCEEDTAEVIRHIMSRDDDDDDDMLKTPSSVVLSQTVEDLQRQLRESQDTIRKLRSSPVKYQDARFENLQRRLQRERVDKERAFDALISIVGNDEVSKRLNIVSTKKKNRKKSSPSPSRTRTSPKSAGYLKQMGKQVLHLRHQLQESRKQEKEHTLRSMRIMEWANEEIMKDDVLPDDEDEEKEEEEEEEEDEELDQVERQLEFENEVDELMHDAPAKDVAKRRLETENEGDEHGIVSFSLSIPIRENEDITPNKACIVVVLHERREVGWLELGRSEPRSCLWPATQRTVMSFLRTIPVSSQVEAKIPKRLRASVYDVGEIAECFGPLQQMTLLGTAVVTDKVLRESPRMSVQRSLVVPSMSDESSENGQKERKKRSTKTRTTEACSGGILEFENHACSWDLLRTSKSNHTIGRATFSMPMTSRGHVHMAQHAFEAPFTALIPSQLLGLYILRIGGTISFLRQKISSLATPDSRLEAALRMQTDMLDEYKRAANELVGFGYAHFKSYKRRSDCSAIRFIPNNVQCLEMRAQIGDWHAVYPSLSFATPAIAASVSLPEQCCKTHKSPEQKHRFGLLSFGKLMKVYSNQVSKLVSKNNTVPPKLAEMMTELSNATARRRDIAFSHILTVAVSSFYHTVRC